MKEKRTAISVECVAWYESDVRLLDYEDLILWTKALPKGAKIHHDIPHTHGKFYLKATWIENRPVERPPELTPTRRGFSLKRS